VIVAEMVMFDNEGGIVTKTAIPFRASNFLVNFGMKKEVNQIIAKAFNEQRRNMENFMDSGSNWVFERCIMFNIEIAPLRPLKGGSNPDGLMVDIRSWENNRFLYNPCNKDEKCFLYCIAYALYGDYIEKEFGKKNLNLK